MKRRTLLICTGLALALAPAAARATDAAQPAIKPPVAHSAAKKAAETENAAVFDGPAIGETVHYRSKYEDTIVALARANDVGYVEFLAANPGVDPWLPGANVDMVIPKMHILPLDAPHQGIVINLPDMRLYYYPHKNARPLSFPIGIGREGLQTPIGQTYVREKAKDFDWRPTPRMRAEDPTLPEVVGPGPDNPMGEFVLYLGWAEYGIHGTNKPYGIGRRSSSGCIRLYPEDIARLWPMVPQHEMVTVVNEPVKAAWIGDQLFVEAHPTMSQADRMEMGNPGDPPTYEMSDQDMRYIVRAAGPYVSHIDWAKVKQIVRERRGYPVPVARRPGGVAVAESSDANDAPAVEPAAATIKEDSAPQGEEQDNPL